MAAYSTAAAADATCHGAALSSARPGGAQAAWPGWRAAAAAAGLRGVGDAFRLVAAVGKLESVLSTRLAVSLVTAIGTWRAAVERIKLEQHGISLGASPPTPDVRTHA